MWDEFKEPIKNILREIIDQKYKPKPKSKSVPEGGGASN
jgi:hypothetical protein